MTDWTKALEEAIKSKADKVPKGYLTMNQLATQEGKSVPRMNSIVQQLGKRVERKAFRIVSGARVVPVPHYRLRG